MNFSPSRLIPALLRHSWNLFSKLFLNCVPIPVLKTYPPCSLLILLNSTLSSGVMGTTLALASVFDPLTVINPLSISTSFHVRLTGSACLRPVERNANQITAYLPECSSRSFISFVVRVREKITLQSIALRFRPDLVDMIGLDRKRSLSYTEDSAREDRAKMA